MKLLEECSLKKGRNFPSMERRRRDWPIWLKDWYEITKIRLFEATWNETPISFQYTQDEATTSQEIWKLPDFCAEMKYLFISCICAQVKSLSTMKRRFHRDTNKVVALFCASLCVWKTQQIIYSVICVFQYIPRRSKAFAIFSIIFLDEIFHYCKPTEMGY